MQSCIRIFVGIFVGIQALFFIDFLSSSPFLYTSGRGAPLLPLQGGGPGGQGGAGMHHVAGRLPPGAWWMQSLKGGAGLGLRP